MGSSRISAPGRMADQAWAILDALDIHVAVLGVDGGILHTNRAWSDFAAGNPLPDGSAPLHVGIGANYLDVCRTAVGVSAENAYAAYRGIKDVLEGRKRNFVLEYPCHSPRSQRWFLMKASPLKGTRPRMVAVVHTDITALKHAEIETLRKTRELACAIEDLEVFAGQLKSSLRLDQSIQAASLKGRAVERHAGGKGGEDDKARLTRLSMREREVMAGLVRGERVADIAGRLSLSAKSVSTYRARVMEKLQARTTADLVTFMVRHGAL